MESLAELLRRHRADDTVNRAIGRLIRSDLIVIRRHRHAPHRPRRRRSALPRRRRRLRETLDRAHEQRAPAGFDELMPKTLAAATVDRLLHHAHVLLTNGSDSYRLPQATAGKGVRPLT